MRKAKTAGMLQAIAEYKLLSRSKDSSQYYFSERECNSLGYYLMRNNRLSDAIALFTFNTEQFPCSGNVFDSLGEAYLKAGDKTKALANYRKSLELDPGNGNAANMIRKIESE